MIQDTCLFQRQLSHKCPYLYFSWAETVQVETRRLKMTQLAAAAGTALLPTLPPSSGSQACGQDLLLSHLCEGCWAGIKTLLNKAVTDMMSLNSW